MNAPLTGLRIIEFAGLGPGPFCAMMLADHGAEVIRVDQPGAPHGVAGDPVTNVLHRSRRTLSINLKSEGGVNVARRLCANAHGIIEGFRPGVMERLGIGPEILFADNPALVYGRMTGWGQNGPMAHAAGHDLNYIALSGALHATGRAGQKPTPPLNLVGDFGGGGMMLAFGVLAALFEAQRSGRGQVVDCAMTEGSAVLMAMIAGLRAEGRWRRERGVNTFDSGAHFYEIYETADGEFISVAAVEPQFYRLLMEKIGLGDEAAVGGQFDEALWPERKRMLEGIFISKTREEWCSVLEGTDACFAPVLSMDEAPEHPHNVARAAYTRVDGAFQAAPAPRYSRSKTVPPQALRKGERVSDEILASFGYSADEIQNMRVAGFIA